MPHEPRSVSDSLAVVEVASELGNGRREIVNELRDLCKELADKDVKNIILDFSQVSMCPSMVFGNIVVLAKRLKESQGRVALAAAKPHLAKTIRITGLTKSVDVFDSTEEAIAELEELENE